MNAKQLSRIEIWRSQLGTVTFLAKAAALAATGREVQHVIFRIAENEGLAHDSREVFNLSGEGLIGILSQFVYLDAAHVIDLENAPPRETETLVCDIEPSANASDALIARLPYDRVLFIHRNACSNVGFSDLSDFVRALDNPQLFDDQGARIGGARNRWLRKHAGLLHELNFISDKTQREIAMDMPHEAIERMLADERVKHSNQPMPQNVPPMPTRTD